MPRPKIDSDKMRALLLEAAEKRLRLLGSPRFSVTDIAADCNMSQSNVYRFFPNKSALMAALVNRWFEDIEAELVASVQLAQGWKGKLTQYVVVQLRLKTVRFDEDPELFKANLALATENTVPVLDHVTRLRTVLEGILKPAFAGDDLVGSLALVEDATQIFRDPYNIARFRERCTEERATQVVNAVISDLERRATRRPSIS